MSNVGHQQYWVTGSRFYFQRDAIAGTVQPIVDFGTIDVANPTFDPTKIELKDGDGGTQTLVDEKIIELSETYEITAYNLNMDNLATMFSGSVSALTQSATQKTDVKHRAIQGRLIKILDGDYDSSTQPRFTLGITSIDSLNTAASGAGTALVLGTDYEVVSLERGLIRILPTSAVVTTDADIYITFTPRAITGNRLILPNSSAGVIQGYGMLIYGRENNTQQTARFAKFSVAPQTPSLSITEYSSLSFTLSVLTEVGAAEEEGRIEYWLGTLPDAS